MARYLLALDQGTSSSRAMLFRDDGSHVATAQKDFDTAFPRDGWVEHDPEVLWQSSLTTLRDVLAKARVAAADVAALGITNQRETTVLWDKASGEPVYPAIVWQDRRTAEHCARIRADGMETKLQEATGLLVDPYFSGTKLAWLLDQVGGARARAERGELLFGTVDCFLLWRLTGGAKGGVHRTDASNASRTQLYNLRSGTWDPELLEYFRIPPAVLPEVCDNVAEFGTVSSDLLGAGIPITGMAGDQQAALVGQACFQPGHTKSTYGTGCFAMVNTGPEPLASSNRLLTTVGYRINGQTTYALEGSIFVAGAAIKWLRDRAGLVASAADTESIAERLDGNAGGVYMVPAFTGLGAPWWDAEARGMVTGLTLDSTGEHIALAGLQSVAFQTRDLTDAMAGDGAAPSALRVDGGMVVNNWLCQFLADVLELPVQRPEVTETTAYGAALLAGVGAGVLPSLQAAADVWRCERIFQPAMAASKREQLLAGWARAVARTRSAPAGAARG